ncbi:hypothetical protein B0H63DRAFT_98342 [Podospora didyma]|uniref:Mid2 domain-containing protein n=1 Tax=Podospora didyma TaxID=330526 RepID=A0AAE0U3E9_9PEZI|nr:hypothetical protein B0H63DRAFT_98342 [Podospora didyma]
MFEFETVTPPGSVQCFGNPAFIPGFTCPTSSTCQLLAGNTTLLCCPQGANCRSIQPISCDLQQQTLADAPVKTTAVLGTMVQCDNGCCPFGYSCSANTTCERNSNQEIPPVQRGQSLSSSSLSTLPATPTPSVPPSSSTTTSPPLQSTTPVDSPASSGSIDTKVLLPVIIISILALVAIVGFCVWFRLKALALRAAAANPPRASTGRFDKAELDAETGIRRQTIKCEMPGTREHVELPGVSNTVPSGSFWSWSTRSGIFHAVELPATPVMDRLGAEHANSCYSRI